MKIKKLEIKNYKQFKDLSLNLTYPKGHPKEGEALDKVCIISQSDTHNVDILDTIKKSVIDFSQWQELYKPFNEFTGEATDDKYISSNSVTKSNIEVKSLFTKDKSQIDFQKNNDLNLISKFEKNYFFEINTTSMYYKNSESEDEENISFEKLLIKSRYNNFINRHIININDENDSVWEIMESKIKNYETLQTRNNNLLTSRLRYNDNYSKEDFKRDILEWRNKNENLLEKIPLIINDILKYFNLKLLKIYENQKSYADLLIRDLSNGNIIKYNNLSTGIKNLISVFISLKIYNPKDSIILIAEPKNSFYSDIQRNLIELCMEIGENNQFIFTTYSPITASSFEPWEVIELKI